MRFWMTLITAYCGLPSTAFAFVLLASAQVMSGCSSMERSVAFGAGVGAVTGTGMGIAVEPSPGSALIGAGVGMILGGALGYLGHKQHTNDSEKTETHKMKPPKPRERPPLTSPNVSRMWIPPKIEGNRYQEGHWLYLLEPPQWSNRDGE